jgi:predicted glycosyltransferase
MWVQHLVGTGHQRRAAALARALAQAGARVCYLSGGMPVPDLDLDGCESHQLPAARSVDMRYHTLVDESGAEVDEGWRDARRAMLLDLVARFGPHAVITETWPFGRGLMRFELEPLMQFLEAARPAPLVVCSVRDIVERRRQPVKYERMAERAQRYFDLVLVHSDPALLPFGDTFPHTARLGARLRYTGYVSDREPLNRRDPTPDGPVVVSAGGGFFGERLLMTAIEAAPLCPVSARRWLVLAGPNLPADRLRALRARAGAGVEVQRNRPDFHELLRSCAVSVSQGGYNTVVDLLASRVPAVVVPYEDARESEQVVRARHLERLGLVRVVDHATLDPGRLAHAIAAAAKGDGMPPTTLNLDGARQGARLVMEALRARS